MVGELSVVPETTVEVESELIAAVPVRERRSYDVVLPAETHDPLIRRVDNLSPNQHKENLNADAAADACTQKSPAQGSPLKPKISCKHRRWFEFHHHSKLEHIKMNYAAHTPRHTCMSLRHTDTCALSCTHYYVRSTLAGHHPTTRPCMCVRPHDPDRDNMAGPPCVILRASEAQLAVGM